MWYVRRTRRVADLLRDHSSWLAHGSSGPPTVSSTSVNWTHVKGRKGAEQTQRRGVFCFASKGGALFQGFRTLVHIKTDGCRALCSKFLHPHCRQPPEKKKRATIIEKKKESKSKRRKTNRQPSAVTAGSGWLAHPHASRAYAFAAALLHTAERSTTPFRLRSSRAFRTRSTRPGGVFSGQWTY